MRFRSVLLLFLVASNLADAEVQSDSLEKLLSTSPRVAAEKAHAIGNRQYLAVPGCGELLPGYPMTGLTSAPPEFDNAAHPAGSCEQFFGKEKIEVLQRLRFYAETYNKRLHELLSIASAAGVGGSAANCEQLELQAIKLAGEKELQGAAQLYDRVLAECPARPDSMTSRGVLYAVMGERAKAEVIINDAILLAERIGDQCRADVSRGELAMIKGGPRSKSLPNSCKSSGR